MGLGWAVLGVAIFLLLFLLIPFAPEKTSAVPPATSTGPAASQTPSPQTWVLSSTVVTPSPTAGGAAWGPDLDASDDAGDWPPLIIQVPARPPASPETTGTPTTTPRSASASGTAQLPSPTTTGSASSCPEVTPTGVVPLLDEEFGGDLGSTSDTGDGTGDGDGTGEACD